jgi:alkyldihydroxyacetonephosphate synthase
MSNEEGYTPKWFEEETPHGTYRSLFKWNDPKVYKHPNRGLYALMKEVFGMIDDDFAHPSLALEKFDIEIAPRLSRRHLERLMGFVGEENIRWSTYDRVKASYGAGMVDALRLRHHIVENLPDIVLFPRDKEDIQTIIRYCDDHRIPVYIYGG